MASWKPPVVGEGSNTPAASQYTVTPPTFFKNYDYATSKPNFPKDRGGDPTGYIWTTTQDNGFMVINLFSLVTVTPATTTVTVGDTVPLTAAVTGAVATAGVTWTVEEPGAGMTVSPTGVVTATAAGTFHAIATSVLDATKTASSTVTVTNSTPPPPASNSGGCSSAPAAGISFLALPLALFFWRKRRRHP
jgi:hypothetical protein